MQDEVRPVTALFADIVGSTALGELEQRALGRGDDRAATSPRCSPPRAGATKPRDALEQALDRYERKRTVVMARRVRERLAELQPA